MSFVRVITGVVWAIQPLILGFAIYHEVKLQNTFIFGSAIIYMVALLAVPFIVRQKRLSSVIQTLLIANMMLNGLGAFGWYSTTYHYDDMVHFLSPAILMWGICLWFAPKQLWWAALFSIMIGFIWEPMEYYGDQILATRTYGQAGQPLDTVYDIIMDSLGVMFGLVVFQLTRRPVLAWLRS